MGGAAGALRHRKRNLIGSPNSYCERLSQVNEGKSVEHRAVVEERKIVTEAWVKQYQKVVWELDKAETTEKSNALPT